MRTLLNTLFKRFTAAVLSFVLIASTAPITTTYGAPGELQVDFVIPAGYGADIDFSINTKPSTNGTNSLNDPVFEEGTYTLSATLQPNFIIVAGANYTVQTNDSVEFIVAAGQTTDLDIQVVENIGTLNVTFTTPADFPANTDIDFSINDPNSTNATNTLNDPAFAGGDFVLTATLPAGFIIDNGQNYSVQSDNEAQFTVTAGQTTDLDIQIRKNTGTLNVSFNTPANFPANTDIDFSINTNPTTNGTNTLNDPVFPEGMHQITATLPAGFAIVSGNSYTTVPPNQANFTVTASQTLDLVINIAEATTLNVQFTTPANFPANTDIDFSIDTTPSTNGTNTLNDPAFPVGNFTISTTLPNNFVISAGQDYTVASNTSATFTTVFNQTLDLNIQITEVAPAFGTLDLSFVTPANFPANTDIDFSIDTTPSTNGTNALNDPAFPTGSFTITTTLPNGFQIGNGQNYSVTGVNTATVEILDGQTTTAALNIVATPVATGTLELSFVTPATFPANTDIDFSIDTNPTTNATNTLNDPAFPVGTFTVTATLPVGFQFDAGQNYSVTGVNTATVDVADGQTTTAAITIIETPTTPATLNVSFTTPANFPANTDIDFSIDTTPSTNGTNTLNDPAFPLGTFTITAALPQNFRIAASQVYNVTGLNTAEFTTQSGQTLDLVVAIENVPGVNGELNLSFTTPANFPGNTDIDFSIDTNPTTNATNTLNDAFFPAGTFTVSATLPAGFQFDAGQNYSVTGLNTASFTVVADQTNTVDIQVIETPAATATLQLSFATPASFPANTDIDFSINTTPSTNGTNTLDQPNFPVGTFTLTATLPANFQIAAGADYSVTGTNTLTFTTQDSQTLTLSINIEEQQQQGNTAAVSITFATPANFPANTDIDFSINTNPTTNATNTLTEPTFPEGTFILTATLPAGFQIGNGANYQVLNANEAQFTVVANVPLNLNFNIVAQNQNGNGANTISLTFVKDANYPNVPLQFRLTGVTTLNNVTENATPPTVLNLDEGRYVLELINLDGGFEIENFQGVPGNELIYERFSDNTAIFTVTANADLNIVIGRDNGGNRPNHAPTITATNDNRDDEVISDNNPFTLNVQKNTSISITLVAEDQDESDQVSLALTTDGSSASNPAILTFHEPQESTFIQGATFTWTPGDLDTGEKTFIFTAEDDEGKSSTYTLTVNVSELNSNPKVRFTDLDNNDAIILNPVSINIGDDINFGVTAEDPEPFNNVTLLLVKNPTNTNNPATFDEPRNNNSNPVSGQLTWIPNRNDVRPEPYKFVFQVTSSGGTSIDVTLNVFVRELNNNPVIQFENAGNIVDVSNLTVAANTDFTVNARATDQDTTDTLILSLTNPTDPAPSTAANLNVTLQSANPAVAIFTFRPSTADIGKRLEFTVRAVDSRGAEGNGIIVLNIADPNGNLPNQPTGGGGGGGSRSGRIGLSRLQEKLDSRAVEGREDSDSETEINCTYSDNDTISVRELCRLGVIDAPTKKRDFDRNSKDNMYFGDAPITRAAFTKMMVNITYEPSAIEKVAKMVIDNKIFPFPDVEPIAWFAKYITIAKINQQIHGYPSNGMFIPWRSIERSEAFKILVNTSAGDNEKIANDLSDAREAVGEEAAWFEAFDKIVNDYKGFRTPRNVDKGISLSKVMSRQEAANVVYKMIVNAGLETNSQLSKLKEELAALNAL